MSTNKTSPMRLILKWTMGLCIIVLILIICLFFALPPLLSSDFARNKVVESLHENLKRPVSMETLSFSWTKGLTVSGLNILEKDQSPFLKLQDFAFDISWPALAIRKIIIQNLDITGIELYITRDKSGKTNISDLLESPEKEETKKEDGGLSLKSLPALFVDGHLKEGHCTFKDQRLGTTTRINNLTADLSSKSLTDPITFLLKCTTAVNRKKPEPFALTGAVNLASKGKFDLQKANGSIDLKAGFGYLKTIFDLNKFNTEEEATGLDSSCSIDLEKMADIIAGIVGLPPGLSLKGRFKSRLAATGNITSGIPLNGKSRLTGLSITGGPFRGEPLIEPNISFFQNMILNLNKKSINIKQISLKSSFLTFLLSGIINNYQKTPNIDLALSGNGNLQKISNILKKTHVLPSDLDLTGNMNFSLKGTGEKKALHMQGSTSFRNLKLHGAFLGDDPFYEKHLKIRPDILMNLPEHVYTVESLTVRGKTLNATVKGKVDIEGPIDMKADLSTDFSNIKTLLDYYLPSFFPAQGRLSSDITITGNLFKTLSVKGEQIIKKARIILSSVDENNKASLRTLSPIDLKLNHDVVYNADQDTVKSKQLTGSSDLLQLEASDTTLSKISGPLQLKSKGKLVLDMQKSQKILQELLSDQLTAQGKGELIFNGKGNLTSSDEISILSSWNAKGALSIESVEYQGIGSIENLHSTQLSFIKGVVNTALEGLLNKGPSKLKGMIDFNKPRTEMQVALDAKDILLSHEIDLLGYIIPILIISPSGKLSGQGDISTQASWQGTDWNTQIGQTIQGEGTLNLRDGMISSQDVLSVILKAAGKSETLEFEQIFTGFRLGDSKIYNDDIQVNGKDLKIGLKGWTSLVYVPSKKGNPMEYEVTGDYLQKKMGKDAQTVLSILGGGESKIPVRIAGTVQSPRVSLKLPKLKDLF